MLLNLLLIHFCFSFYVSLCCSVYVDFSYFVFDLYYWYFTTVFPWQVSLTWMWTFVFSMILKMFYSTISRPNEYLGNPTYTPTTPTIKKILDNHRSVLRSFAISTKNEELNLPSFYRIFKLHIKSLQTAFLYCWVCQMLLETSFQIGKIYYHVFVC